MNMRACPKCWEETCECPGGILDITYKRGVADERKRCLRIVKERADNMAEQSREVEMTALIGAFLVIDSGNAAPRRPSSKWSGGDGDRTGPELIVGNFHIELVPVLGGWSFYINEDASPAWAKPQAAIEDAKLQAEDALRALLTSALKELG